MNIPQRFRNRSLFETFEIVFAGLTAVVSLLYLAKAFLGVALPFQMDYGEGMVLAGASRIAEGLSAYPCPTVPPYVIQCYGPVPLYLTALCIKWFGLSFALPRIVVVASGVWCAILIGLLVRHGGGSFQIALAFGALYLTRPVVQDWLSWLRVDLIGLAFSLTGLYIFVRWRRWFVCVPCFVAAVFCKTSLVAAPLACFIDAAMRKEGSKALRLAAWCLAAATAVFLSFQHATQGWFAFHTIWANAIHPYSLAHAVWYLRAEMTHDYFLLPLALAAAYYARPHSPLRLPLIYLGFSGVMSLTVGKLGANFNYFLEWESALCLCAGLGYHLLRTHFNFRRGIGAALPAGLALLVLTGVHIRRVWPGRSENFSECRQAYNFVRTFPGAKILSENLGAQVLARKPPEVFDPFPWTREVLQAGWPDVELINLIRSHQIDLVVLSADPETLARDPDHARWPPSVMEAVQKNYTLTRTFECQDARFIYQPAASK